MKGEITLQSALVASALTLCVGYYCGFKSIDNSADKEIIELNIELTKLNIKKLKG